MADIPLGDLKRRLREQRPADARPLREMRDDLDAIAQRVRIDPRVTVTPVQAGECAAEWLRPAGARPGAALLYLHGGGFVGGSCASHRHLASAIALAANVDTLLLDYHLAPEHPYPAAEHDAAAAYRWLLDQGISAPAIAGDSAGGGLAVATLLRARDSGWTLPSRAALLSPWLDLDLEGDSITRLAATDPTLRADQLARFAALYRSDKAPPRVLDADFTGLPPMLIQVGAEEILLDNSVRLARKLDAAGAMPALEIWPELFHVWQAFGPWLVEAREAVARIGVFLAAPT